MLSTAAHFPTLTYSKLQLRRDFPHISRGQIWREQIMATEIQTSQATVDDSEILHQLIL